MRYRLRTLLIVLAILPPLLGFGYAGYRAWQRSRQPFCIGEGGYIWVYEDRNGQIELVSKAEMKPPSGFRLSREAAIQKLINESAEPPAR